MSTEARLIFFHSSLINLICHHCSMCVEMELSSNISWLTNIVHPIFGLHDSSLSMSGALPPAAGNGRQLSFIHQSWLAAPRGWKPIQNNRAFIFIDPLCNNIWARDLARPAHGCYIAVVITATPASPSPFPSLWDQNTKHIPICFVDLEPGTGISLTHLPPLLFFYLLMMLKSGIILYSQ